MLYRTESSEDDLHDHATGSARVPLVGWVAAALAAVFGALSLIEGLPVDLRWFAPLASACLNVFIVAIGIRLAAHERISPPGTLGWRLIATALWQAFRRTPEATAWQAVVRAVNWQPWVVPACACLSAALAAAAWRPLPPAVLLHATASPGPAIVSGAASLVFAFVTLVAERYYSERAHRSHAAASLARMLRVVLLTALAVAASAAWLVYTRTGFDGVIRVAALFSAAVAVELAIRAVLAWFSTPRAGAGAAGVPASVLAGMLRWQPSPFASVGSELRTRYGIDLRQSWVVQSVLRLLPATLVAVGVCAWLLTAVVVLNPDQRAVYERFGAPVAVWQPGLHVGMPWPFGSARFVDNGAVHQLVVSGSADTGSVAAPAASADGPAPDQLNRLWDVPHPWETTQVIAGASGSQQNFQIVNADVRLDYRVGLTDAAARAALYRAVDPASTVRSAANREVVHYLASHTLESLLETNQTAMADNIRRAVQLQLDRLVGGIEVVAVVIESVHPPAGAAAAWHSVQAAQIRAQGRVAQARGFAAGVLGSAQQQALANIALANARASDTLSSARVQQIDFDADVVAYRLGGPAFPFEYYLSRLKKGLQNVRMTIIDDRLIDGRRATVDLRSYPAGDLTGARDDN